MAKFCTDSDLATFALDTFPPRRKLPLWLGVSSFYFSFGSERVPRNFDLGMNATFNLLFFFFAI